MAIEDLPLRERAQVVLDEMWLVPHARLVIEDLLSELEASTSADLLSRYRRAMVENAHLTQKLAAAESSRDTAKAVLGGSSR